MLPMSDVIHLAITGIAQGCAYGLIALGFVLIYKATEVVNFAHGEFMMLGAFAVLTFSEVLGWGFWPAFGLGCLSIGAVGYLVDAQIMRRIIGQSQASVFILTVAFGFIFRSLAGMIFGWNTQSLDTPFDGRIALGGGIEIGTDRLAIVGATVVLVGALYLFFARTRVGIAMQAASQNQLAAFYMGIPVKRLISFTWAIGAMIAAAATCFAHGGGAIRPPPAGRRDGAPRPRFRWRLDVHRPVPSSPPPAPLPPRFPRESRIPESGMSSIERGLPAPLT